MLAPVAIVPDLDVLLSAHRVYLHTLFIPIAIVAASFLYKTKKGVHHDFIFLASLYYLSHILIDFFPGPVAIFWPLTNVGYGLNVGVTVNQKSTIPIIRPYLSLTEKRIPVPNVVTDAIAITPQGVVIAIFLFVAIILTQREKILRILK